jgi:hypothetical protein
MRLTAHLYLVPIFKKKCSYICPPTLCRQDAGRDDDNNTWTFTDYHVIHKVNVRSQPLKRVGQKMSLKCVRLGSLFSPVLPTVQTWFYCYPTTISFLHHRPEHGTCIAQTTFIHRDLPWRLRCSGQGGEKRPVFFHTVPTGCCIYLTVWRAFSVPCWYQSVSFAINHLVNTVST